MNSTKPLIAATTLAVLAGAGHYSRSVAQTASPARAATTTTVSAVTPDYVEEGISRKVQRAQSDMRSMATGVEAFYIDNNKYPGYSAEGTFRKPAPGEQHIVSFDRYPGITTPVAFISRLFEDPFATQDGQTFGYYAPEGGWIMFSPGPDGKFDLGWEAYNTDEKQPSSKLLIKAYDPTNGVMSGGDIFRVKQ